MSRPQKVLRNNVLTALGALCLDEHVRESYFHGVPPAPLLHQHGIPITDDEIADLTQMVSLTHSPTQSDVAMIVVCPRKPCLYATLGIEAVVAAGVMDSVFRTAMFESFDDPNFDPTLVAYQYGLTLTPDEHTLLIHLLVTKKKEIAVALEKLGKKIKDGCPTDFILKKKFEFIPPLKKISAAA